jgi:hypothetical protein
LLLQRCVVGRNADPKPAEFLVLEHLRGLFSRTRRGGDRSRILQENPPRFGQLHHPGAANEQRKT